MCKSHICVLPIWDAQRTFHKERKVNLHSIVQKEGSPEQLVKVQECEVVGNVLDVTVASRDLVPGQT